MDLNETIQQIISLHDTGGNPQHIMQQMMNNGTAMGQMKTQLQNMAQGRSPQEFILQIARQNGVNEQNLQGLLRILGGK